jgi:surfeit locus 1 family protein
MNQHTILVDNQSLRGQAGYKVLTPLWVDHNQALILVDRGWIPLGKNRANLPTLPPIVGKVDIQGRLYQPVQGFKLPVKHRAEASHVSDVWPLRVLGIDLRTLGQTLGHTLYPLILRLEPGDTLGFEIVPFAIQQGMPASKHLGYAWQWFMMALTVVIYYGVINTSCLEKGSKKTKDCEKD